MLPGADPRSSRSVEPGPLSASAYIKFEQIRERAYDLWERHHRPDDFSIELWLMAERELRAERRVQAEEPEAHVNPDESGRFRG
ncbi:MAG: hypothetical protein JWQ05_769 [Methylobacterium sp.]|nr:hypothetical protein [Methylobacterium sp.]